ncbi:MAG: VCBS repeat-containing protein [Verrucomicrobia bacterium]|nr:VCBS repeat-containing protein [Verrucomicrobiota bacterium]
MAPLLGGEEVGSCSVRGSLWNKFLSITLCSILLPDGASVQADPQRWHTEAGYRWTEAQVLDQGRDGFRLLSSEQTGINFSNRLTEASIAANRVLANGSGVAVGDIDKDGLPDLYICGLENPSVLYRNLGHWKFKDVTSEAGVSSESRFSRGAVFADVNGDGTLDLLVSTLNEGVLCFFNDGQGRFLNRTIDAGTRRPSAAMTLALADIDGNGTLDLYVANNRTNDMRDLGRISFSAVGGKPVIPPKDRNRFVLRNGQLAEYGEPDQLLLNDGKGRFRLASWNNGTFLDEAGKPLAEPPLDWGLSATFRDINGDLAPDLYVCNDYWTPDRFWINDGHGRFRAIEKLALRKLSASSMGADFADLDRDGHVDFFVVDMLSRDLRLRKRQMFAEKPVMASIGVIDDRPQVMRNTLFRNRGDETFAEMADLAHVAASDWSWSPIALDVDLDGYEDWVISAGHFRDVQDLDASRAISARQHSWNHFKEEAARQKAFTRELEEHYQLYPPLRMPIVAFRNLKNWRFEEVTERWGLNQAAVRHGMAAGDFDGDGDLDLVVNCLNGPAEIYENQSVRARVAVRLKGQAPNTQSIGAKVALINGAIPNQSTEIVSGGHYLSGSEALAVFAAGTAREGMRLEVAWRGGRTSVIQNVAANRVYEIEESGALERPSGGAFERGNGSAPRSTLHAPTLFKDVSHLLNHAHTDVPFNDFERQPLLPFKLSQSGPGIAWFDLDADGHDDLIIGASQGDAPIVLRSNERGAFSRITSPPTSAVSSDTGGIVGWTDPNGRAAFITGITGYEAPSRHGARQFRLSGAQLDPGAPLGSEMTSGGAVALGDVDGNGQLALFVAGSVAPGRYPLGSPSKIYRHEGGRWVLDARNSLLLENLGIVNGAIWSDLTGDGFPELILACEWGPIRIFQRRAGALFEVTAEFGFSEFTGWWKGVTTGDLDGDGRMDLVASNWGLNSTYQASKERPLAVVYGELARPGIMDVVETDYDAGTGRITPRRQLPSLAASLPFLFEGFASHKSYSEAGLSNVLGDRMILARRAEVRTLATCVFLNRGGRFEMVELPSEAQLAPAFSVSVADFDGDGREDVFLSQNFFPMQPEVPRLDAGRGLWLQGDGKGGLASVPGKKSGIAVYGEQRGAALCDFNEDGRIDLAVTQNGAATKLYQNAQAAAGLRIKLRGPPGNLQGVGAVIRLRFGDRLGPAREIHAGSGYWSQDSAIQVMGTPASPIAVSIRWPAGRTTTTSLPDNTKEAVIGVDGNLISRQ